MQNEKTTPPPSGKRGHERKGESVAARDGRHDGTSHGVSHMVAIRVAERVPEPDVALVLREWEHVDGLGLDHVDELVVAAALPDAVGDHAEEA